MAFGFDGRFNVSKTVGWQTPARTPDHPPRRMVEEAIKNATEADVSTIPGHTLACAAACTLLVFQRYAPPPETDEQIEIMNLIFDAYPAIRDKVEIVPNYGAR